MFHIRPENPWDIALTRKQPNQSISTEVANELVTPLGDDTLDPPSEYEPHTIDPETAMRLQMKRTEEQAEVISRFTQRGEEE